MTARTPSQTPDERVTRILAAGVSPVMGVAPPSTAEVGSIRVTCCPLGSLRTWGSFGVIDLGQAKDGTGVGNPNGYMASIDFSVVYSYNTQANSWDRLANSGTCVAPDAPPALADCMSTGSGYWVWANKAGTLVP